MPLANYIEFVKMQAAGNDFVLINNLDQAISASRIIKLTPKLCNRHFGIGADGIMALQPSEIDGADYTMFYRNADGSDAGMCGNGARCMALFAKRCGLKKRELTFNVHSKKYRAELIESDKVRVAFPVQPKITKLNIQRDTIWQLNTGTDHIVKKLPADELKNNDLIRTQGRSLRYHSVFEPKGTNVNFIHPLSNNTLFLRTYERGVEDLTLACGTGAIASAIAWHHSRSPSNSEHHTIIIQTDGGKLQVEFDYNNTSSKYSNITLTGEAHFVFEGRYKI